MIGNEGPVLAQSSLFGQQTIEYEKKKKEDGKRARADKQQVLDMLFSAFEKHQYYNIKDLVDITKQPVYLAVAPTASSHAHTGMANKAGEMQANTSPTSTASGRCKQTQLHIPDINSVFTCSHHLLKNTLGNSTLLAAVIYLKEILREIGIYNVKGTHKNTWELKPEYRHYQVEDKSD
ncbi:General transcription factor IIF subunit 2 [Anas platyrhynchos]|uniref:General transcription factor IIF subunit 2 n=1 Tax=Anas platyrhynchos TaxID=8839 RepID=R0L0U2_ANAPL|nr:General transcription factor IIF subunit 2 [Anas platyrhynchos]